QMQYGAPVVRTTEEQSQFREDLHGGVENVTTVLKATEQPELVPTILHEMRYGWTPETVFTIWGAWYPAMMFVSLLFIIGIIYSTMRILQIRRAEWAGFRKVAHTVTAEAIPRTHMRW